MVFGLWSLVLARTGSGRTTVAGMRQVVLFIPQATKIPFPTIRARPLLVRPGGMKPTDGGIEKQGRFANRPLLPERVK
jgi:hypothetical protein